MLQHTRCYEYVKYINPWLSIYSIAHLLGGVTKYWNRFLQQRVKGKGTCDCRFLENINSVLWVYLWKSQPQRWLIALVSGPESRKCWHITLKWSPFSRCWLWGMSPSFRGLESVVNLRYVYTISGLGVVVTERCLLFLGSFSSLVSSDLG